MSTLRHAGSRRFSLGWIALAVYGAYLVVPLLSVLAVSLRVTAEHAGTAVGDLSLINYANIWRSPDLMAAIANSFAYVLLNIAITIPVALPAAYAFSRFAFAGDKHVFFMLIAFRVTPPVVLVLPVFFVFSSLGLLNSPLGIALAHCLFTVPISIWVLETFMTAIPRELDETAFVDGYSVPRFFVKILIPLMAPGIGVAAFFCFMFSWVEVVFARILTITNGKPITMAINALFGFSTDIGLVMAMTAVSLIPGALMIFFVRNHIAKGFTIGKSAG